MNKQSPQSTEQTKNKLINVNEASNILGISDATCRNWVKRGLLKSAFFDKLYIYESSCFNLKKQILSGDIDILSSRRNKTYKRKDSAYLSSFSTDSPNFANAKIVSEYLSKEALYSENHIVSILCKAAFDLFSEIFNDKLQEMYHKSHVERKNEISKKSNCNMVYTSYTEDIFNNILKKIAPILLMDLHKSEFDNLNFVYNQNEDTLGLLYEDIQDLKSRKRTGSYYTPSFIPAMPAKFAKERSSEILDPACGSGIFLCFFASFKDINSLHGYDIDAISVAITKLNLCFKYKRFDDDFLRILNTNIVKKDFLLSKDFDDLKNKNLLIVANPPWGSKYDKCYLHDIRDNFDHIGKKHPESYDLFLEKAIEITSNGDVIAFLVPEAILQVKSHAGIRKKILENTKLLELVYFDNIFKNVQCPSIMLVLKKGSTKELFEKDATIRFVNSEKIKTEFKTTLDRKLSTTSLNISCDDKVWALMNKMVNSNCLYLKNNADFAMGIVTGDNKKFLKSAPAKNLLPIVTGKDIFKFRDIENKYYIDFKPQNFQQCADSSLYQTTPKIIYRFISDKPICMYDYKKMITLNSANFFIPHFENLTAEYICAVLNSRAVCFYFKNTFRTSKVLRSMLEKIPIPSADAVAVNEITDIVKTLVKAKDDDKYNLYNELDRKISTLYNLTNEDISYIKEFTDMSNLF